MCLFHVICSDGVLESLKRIGLYNFIELTMFNELSSTSFDLCMSLHQRLGIAYRKVSWRELGLKLSQRNVREWFRICETGGIICSKISAFQWYSDTQYVRFHTPFMCPWELSIKAPALLANFFIFIAPFFHALLFCHAGWIAPWGGTMSWTLHLLIYLWANWLTDFVKSMSCQRGKYRMQLHPAHWATPNGFDGNFKPLLVF